jgi:hypothetical protein
MSMMKICSAMCSNTTCDMHVSAYDLDGLSIDDTEDYSDICPGFENDYIFFFNAEEDLYIEE